MAPSTRLWPALWRHRPGGQRAGRRERRQGGGAEGTLGPLLGHRSYLWAPWPTWGRARVPWPAWGQARVPWPAWGQALARAGREEGRARRGMRRPRIEAQAGPARKNTAPRTPTKKP